MDDGLNFWHGLLMGGAIVAYLSAFIRERQGKRRVFTSQRLKDANAREEKRWRDANIRPLWRTGHTLTAIAVVWIVFMLNPLS